MKMFQRFLKVNYSDFEKKSRVNTNWFGSNCLPGARVGRQVSGAPAEEDLQVPMSRAVVGIFIWGCLIDYLGEKKKTTACLFQ